tara:strand:- start:524 stop:1303 length:780 start_codon:yes stop_codon:yes gene_type:complete
MKKPLVSILISSYNKGNYIEECINSCLNQTYKNFEIILLDNFSNDKTNRILKKFSKQIKILRRKKISKFPSLNQIDLLIKAFKVSKGSIICLLDADDFFHQNKIEKIKKLFLLKKKNNVIFDLPIIKKKNYKKKFSLKKKYQKNIWPTIIPTSSISFRRVFFKKCLDLKIFNKFDLLEIDFRINVLAINFFKNYYITKQNITYYRETENSIMSNMKKYSKKWWIKRNQAHQYMINLFKRNKIKYNNLDYSITKMINLLI